METIIFTGLMVVLLAILFLIYNLHTRLKAIEERSTQTDSDIQDIKSGGQIVYDRLVELEGGMKKALGILLDNENEQNT